MSLQILLQGRILGTEAFLLSGPGDELDFAGRAQWLSLLSEVLPRAIIAELGLSKMLLGSSGGEQFLIVLPEEVRAIADDFFVAARADMQRLSGGTLSLIWAVTENLGDWTVVRKRLNDELLRKQGTPLGTGDPTAPVVPAADPAYFAQLGEQLRHANSIAWNPDSPAALTTGAGKHTWAVGNSMDAIPLARHTALTDDDNSVAEPAVPADVPKGARCGACCAAMSTILESACVGFRPSKSTSRFR